MRRLLYRPHCLQKRLQSLDQGMTELYCCNSASSKLKGEELWRVEP